MPDIEMDEEQLVGAVTHMIGDKQVLIYMEQALAKVIASKEKVKVLTATAKDIDTKVERAKAALADLDQLRQDKLVAIDKEAVIYQIREFEKVDKAASAKRAAKEQELADILSTQVQARTSLESTQAAIADAKDSLQILQGQVIVEKAAVIKAQEEKDQAEKELGRINSLLQEINRKTSSIKTV